MNKLVIIILCCLMAAGLVLAGFIFIFIPVKRTISADRHAPALILTSDLSKMSPLDFIEYLKAKPEDTVYVISSPDGWISKDDIEKLLALADSKTPCAAVVSPLSSLLPEGGSTVGNEAMFILEGYKAGHYPPALYSKNPKVKRVPEEYRKWWEQTKKLLEESK